MPFDTQEGVSADSKFALGQVTSVLKEQNLPALFNEGENSQVTKFYSNVWNFTTNKSWILFLFSKIIQCVYNFEIKRKV